MFTNKHQASAAQHTQVVCFVFVLSLAVWSPLWISQLSSSASGVCVVSPLWLYCLGMRTLWEPWQVKGGLRGCLRALALLYPANDTCHFCSQSTGQKWSHGQSSYKGSWEIGGYTRICGEHQLYVLDLNFLSFTFSLVNKWSPNSHRIVQIKQGMEELFFLLSSAVLFFPGFSMLTWAGC